MKKNMERNKFNTYYHFCMYSNKYYCLLKKKKYIFHIINSYDIEIIKIASLIVIPLRSKFSFVNFKKKNLKRCLRILFNLQKNLFIYFSILTLKSSHITSEIVREGGV